MIFAFLASMARLSTPLLFACMGGLFSERSGVINIALEGLMLVGAMSAAILTLATGNPAIGFLGGGLLGAALGLVYGFFVVRLRADQIVAGMALNLLAQGAIPLVLKVLYDSTGSTPPLALSQRFTAFPLWFAWVVVLFTWLVLRDTPLGLWVSFAGENPAALDAAGISVRKVRFTGVALSGLFAGFGGASLSIFLSSAYSRDMVAGRGFMALAALIFGKWKPVPAALACLFFGAMEAVQIRLQGNDVGIPAEFVQMIPYLATILVLAGFVGKMAAPKAIGTYFEK